MPDSVAASGSALQLTRPRTRRVWGGGVDTQRTLPFGTPEKIGAEVLQRCKVLSQNGGFVFNAVHNVQARTPVENIVAMMDAVKEFNGWRGFSVRHEQL